ncbi:MULTISPECIES: hypothetical protein [unclassified Streptomyces]|uniref:hypothetical protein n=1 Tax=unclassified Streptomyces TaxID=2593676 RepID=UPI002441DE36|nr:hypothetical protein [Streptomyces sp. DH41]MDG9728452.1 hypothetical protein [Streptomyces sp. DH41]
MTNNKTTVETASLGSPVGGFGMPQALVILGFLAAAVVLRLAAQTSVQDTVVLLAVVGGVSVGVLLAAGFHGRSRRRLWRRVLNAVLAPGSGS